MKIRFKPEKLVPISELKLNPKNRNAHPDAQIDRLAKILEYQGWRYPVKVSKRSGFVTSGHGRVLAAQKNGWKEVPVSLQDYETEEQEYADTISDNAIAAWSELDLSGINSDIPEFGPELDIEMLGIEDFALDPSDKEYDPENPYSDKIQSPIYEAGESNPNARDLYDDTTAEKLRADIEAIDAPLEVKKFLGLAANRHTVFNYEKIADFYAHAPREVKDLMEDSALVIIREEVQTGVRRG